MKSRKDSENTTLFETFMQELETICKGIDLSHHNILTDFLYRKANVEEKSEWTNRPWMDQNPTVVILRSGISERAAYQLAFYYSNLFPKLNCKVLQDGKNSWCIHMNVLELRKTILPMLAQYLKDNPDVAEQYKRQSVTNEDFSWEKHQIFDNKGIRTSPKEDSENCFDEIVTELINEYQDDTLAPTSSVVIDAKALQSKKNDYDDPYTASFAVSKKAEQSVPKMLGFFNHFHAHSAEYKTQGPENAGVIAVHPIALMEGEFLSSLKNKADHLSHAKIDYYRKQSNRITYTLDECVELLSRVNAALANDYNNTAARVELQNALKKLAYEIKQTHPDSEDVNAKETLMQLIAEVTTKQENYLKEQNLYFPLIAVKQEPYHHFMGGLIQPPPKMIPDSRTPVIFNNVADVCKNLEDIANKKYVIHSLPPGAVYNMKG